MQQRDITRLFFELVCLGIGTGRNLSHSPTKEEWEILYEMATKQAVTGIAFTGIERLPAEQRPAKELLLKWYNVTLLIAKQNTLLNKQAVAVARKFEEEGFENVILKGQGIATLYDEPARRTAGDIDIWLAGGRKKIMDYVRKFLPDAIPNYHHVNFPLVKGVAIEVHFTPSWMYNYFTNKRLQDYFEREMATQLANRVALGNEGTVCIPDAAFNRVFILLHIYRHLFQEGIGLRQLLDYYYVLRQGFTPEERDVTVARLKELGMLRFAGAVMYVLKEVFLIDDAYLILPPLEKEGKELLDNVLIMGNFGKYSPSYAIQKGGNLWQRATSRTMQNVGMIKSYPSENLWAPLFRIWHFFWMRMNK